MKTMLTATLLALLAATPARADESPACGDCGKETYGTSIVWEGSPADAAKRALKEEKLVFVLHVSGEFEDPKFT